MKSMFLIVPRLQKSLNILLRQHWTKIRGTKDCEQDVFDTLLWKSYREKYSKKDNFKGKQVAITYNLYFKDRKRRDYSNYGQKMLDDSLVKAGIIDDDSSKVVVSETLHILYDSKNPRTEIIIKEVMADAVYDSSGAC